MIILDDRFGWSFWSLNEVVLTFWTSNFNLRSTDFSEIISELGRFPLDKEDKEFNVRIFVFCNLKNFLAKMVTMVNHGLFPHSRMFNQKILLTKYLVSSVVDETLSLPTFSGKSIKVFDKDTLWTSMATVLHCQCIKSTAFVSTELHQAFKSAGHTPGSREVCGW